nr:cytochrome ubiquinol oxidase subunit I [Rhizobium leguminosarum]
MDVTALLLSRLQFAFTVSLHIIFPYFTIGLAAWLTVLEALPLRRDVPPIVQSHLHLDAAGPAHPGSGAH